MNIGRFDCILCIILLLQSCFYCKCLYDSWNDLVKVFMDMSSYDSIKMLSYCLDCPSPELEGSFAYALSVKYQSNMQSVSGHIITAVPNSAESDSILNRHAIRGNIALVDRGKVSIIDKCSKLQRAGAIGIVIADDGSCSADFSYCGQRAGSHLEGGLAAYDDIQPWLAIKIPVFIISLSSSEQLRKSMKLRRVEVPPYGYQNITFMRNKYGDYEEL